MLWMSTSTLHLSGCKNGRNHSRVLVALQELAPFRMGRQHSWPGTICCRTA